jgi:sulfate transport system substrate-binding protein
MAPERLVATLSLLAVVLAGCTGDDGSDRRLTLGAYTTPREAYREILPLFAERWKKERGETLSFAESYLGSGAQSRAIVAGFEADVAALSLDPDIDRIAKAGLITHDWRAAKTRGIVTRSVVAFAVRRGNPKGIKDWADLAKPGVDVLTPNPKMSGGAMWNVLALCGAARRGHVAGVAKGDEAALFRFLGSVLKNVRVMDKGARESIVTFEKGVGDVAITYENEVLVGKARGIDYDIVLPRSTILIENPVAVIDGYARKKGTEPAASAFVEFLFTKEAQEVFARHGLRPVHPEVAEASKGQYPDVPDLFTIEDLGGWDRAIAEFFAEGGIFPRAMAEVQAER